MQSDDNIYIYGKNAVEEALRSRQSVEKIYIRHNLPDAHFGSIINLASGRRVPVSRVPGKRLYNYVGKVND
ncbi:MAG TPA: RNA methyltransferase substrate-binding domain-containing protein, partial [Balneolaceae bacterium]|nr:RNA methyltransferase substrate-binding domain-containing protein [Balneolaceae bacterium]